MKTQTTQLFQQLNNETVKNLTNEVNEKFDYGYQTAPAKVFSAAELWNIQKKRRNFGLRRQFAY